jgi:hypothetical protein
LIAFFKKANQNQTQPEANVNDIFLENSLTLLEEKKIKKEKNQRKKTK